MLYTKKTGVTDAVPTKEGFVLRGWATSLEKAEKGIVDYKANVLYKAEKVVPIEATLYAVWEENKPSPKTFDATNTFMIFIALISFVCLSVFAFLAFKKKREN